MVIIVLSLSLVIFTNLSQIKLCHTNVRRGGKRVQRRFATICEFHASSGSCQANPLKTRAATVINRFVTLRLFTSSCLYTSAASQSYLRMKGNCPFFSPIQKVTNTKGSLYIKIYNLNIFEYVNTFHTELRVYIHIFKCADTATHVSEHKQQIILSQFKAQIRD